jgi:hypothetical protein
MSRLRAGSSLIRLCTIVCLAVSGGALAAQQTPFAEIGDRVRLTPANGPRMAGTLVRETADSVVIAGLDGEYAFGANGVSKLEVSAGRHRNTLRGVGIGMLAGAFAGIGIGLVSGNDDGFLAFSPTEKAKIAGIGLGVIGGALGAVIGTTSRTDRWRAVDPAPRITALSGGGTGIGLALAF